MLEAPPYFYIGWCFCIVFCKIENVQTNTNHSKKTTEKEVCFSWRKYNNHC